MMPPSNNSALANRKRPRTLGEVRGHVDITTTVSLIIANDLWGQHAPLFLQGSPGSGKTTVALLSPRVTLCPNRPRGTSDNCGKCDTCMGVDTTNIIQYTCTGADSEAIQNLIDIGRSQPLPKQGSPRYRFFILDEVSNMSNQQLSKFLEVLESTNDYNIWILVSMKPERMDATLSNAILSRCTTFTFPPLTDSELASTLAGGGVDAGIANVLAKYCRGNARLAWREFDRLLLLNPDATPEWVDSILSGGATKEARASMWSMLHDGKVRGVIGLIGGWGTDGSTLATLLREDVVEAMCTNPLPIQGKLMHSLTLGSAEDILYILLSYVGKDIMGTSITVDGDKLSTSKTVVVPVTNGAPLPTEDTLRSYFQEDLSEWGALNRKYILAGV